MYVPQWGLLLSFSCWFLVTPFSRTGSLGFSSPIAAVPSPHPPRARSVVASGANHGAPQHAFASLVFLSPDVLDLLGVHIQKPIEVKTSI